MAAFAATPVGLTASGAVAKTSSAPLDRGDFDISGVYLNAASMHPLPLKSAAALRLFSSSRIDPSIRLPALDARGAFARLINATPDEIAFIPSTTYGENFVLETLGLKRADASREVVTDVLHFDGSLYMYRELAKRGVGVTVLPLSPAHTIDFNRLEDALKGRPKLLAMSLVSMVNGFEPDVKAVCELAHDHGALVYLDAVQAAGAVPIDVRASGVDFLAASTFKWLMGDFGFGFLYVRRDLLPHLQRELFGFRQFRSFDYHLAPTDPARARPFDVDPLAGTAASLFEVGTLNLAAKLAAATSLESILAMGVEEIQRRRQPLIDTMRSALSPRYSSLTPDGSRSPILAFALKDAQAKLGPRLESAGVTIALYNDRFRISPSVYNTPRDVGRLLDVLLA